jgi:G3E family GTPase
MKSTSESKKLPLFLINGFLGSGKTTLIQKILNQESNQKIGLIENEFGEVNIDATLLKREDLQIVELTNGSIFCSCRHQSFIEALITIAKIPLDMLLIESSGISDPSPMETDLMIVKKQIGEYYDYRGNICILDGINFLDLLETLEVLKRQIKYSNIIIINKIDLISQDKIAKIKRVVQNLNPKSIIFETSFCDIPFKNLKLQLNQNLQPNPIKSINTPSNKPQKLLLQADKSINRSFFVDFLQNIATNTFRIKGYCLFEDGWYFIDGVKNKITYSKRESRTGKSEIVVILQLGDPIGDLILKLWNDTF